MGDSAVRAQALVGLGSSRVMQILNQTGLYDTWIKYKNGEQYEMLSIQQPEFQNRSIISLTSDLIDNLSDKGQIQQIKSVRKLIMEDAMFDSRTSRHMSVELSEVMRLRTFLSTHLIIDRWKIAAE